MYLTTLAAPHLNFSTTYVSSSEFQMETELNSPSGFVPTTRKFQRFHMPVAVKVFLGFLSFPQLTLTDWGTLSTPVATRLTLPCTITNQFEPNVAAEPGNGPNRRGCLIGFMVIKRDPAMFYISWTCTDVYHCKNQGKNIIQQG